MNLTADQLLDILAACSGSDQIADADALTTEFSELGIDSLALIESAARIEREHGIAVPDDKVTEFATPVAMLDWVNTAAPARQA